MFIGNKAGTDDSSEQKLVWLRVEFVGWLESSKNSFGPEHRGLVYIALHVYVCCIHAVVHMWGQRTTWRWQFFSSTMWVPGVLVLVPSAFTHYPVSAAQLDFRSEHYMIPILLVFWEDLALNERNRGHWSRIRLTFKMKQNVEQSTVNTKMRKIWQENLIQYDNWTQLNCWISQRLERDWMCSEGRVAIAA